MSDLLIRIQPLFFSQEVLWKKKKFSLYTDCILFNSTVVFWLPQITIMMGSIHYSCALSFSDNKKKRFNRIIFSCPRFCKYNIVEKSINSNDVEGFHYDLMLFAWWFVGFSVKDLFTIFDKLKRKTWPFEVSLFND